MEHIFSPSNCTALSTLKVNMAAIFYKCVEHYHSDLIIDFDTLDASGPPDNGTIYWSVGAGGSHIGLYQDGDVPLWLYPGSDYNKYNHYWLDLDAGTVTAMIWSPDQIRQNARYEPRSKAAKGTTIA